jgi:hypothetical protein
MACAISLSVVRARVAELVRGTPLAEWSIAVRLEATADGAPAEVTCESAFRRARVTLHPCWQRLTLRSLDELLASALGRCLFADCFAALPATTPEAVMDAIAARAGRLVFVTPA